MNGTRSIRIGAQALLVGLLLFGGALGTERVAAEESSATLPPPPAGALPPPSVGPLAPTPPPAVPVPPVEAAPPPPTVPTMGPRPTGDVRARLIAQLGIQYLGELHFLEHLGWRFLPSSGGLDAQVLGGTPCQRTNLRESIDKGDLRVLLSPTITDEQLKNFGLTLPAVSDSMPSLGAWNHRLLIATQNATRKLSDASDADRYTFPKVLVLDSPWWRLSPPKPEWVKRGKLWHPRNSTAAAMHAIYTKDGTAECYVGQLVALWASQYEVMGSVWFDKAYNTEEIWLGRPHLIDGLPFSWNNEEQGYHRRRSLYILPERQNEAPGAVLGEIGHIALSGRCGIIQNQDEGYFCNENFVIVDATPRAAAQLRLKGGFEYVASQTKEALQHHRSTLSLLATGAELLRSKTAVEEILSQPIFDEIRVYIHPFGVLTLREIIEKKLTQKTAAMEIALYSTGRDYAFYKRYRISWIQRWILEQQAKTPSPAPPCGS